MNKPESGWRLKLGIAIFILSIVLPVAGIPFVATLDLSSSVAASLSGALLVSAEILGIASIAVMGKDGFALIKNKFFGFLKQYGPPSSSLQNWAGNVLYTFTLWTGVGLPG